MESLILHNLAFKVSIDGTSLIVAGRLSEQFKSVFTDDDMQNLPFCKKLFPDMTEINFDLDGVIKQLQK